MIIDIFETVFQMKTSNIGSPVDRMSGYFCSPETKLQPMYFHDGIMYVQGT